MNTQAFWNDFMRRPDAREAYQQELRLQQKKGAWLNERRAIEERGENRKKIADELERAPAELKKLIAPMFHIRMVEQFLWMLYDECEKNSFPFLVKLQDESVTSQLRQLRLNFQEGGEERMEQLEKNWYGICTDIAVDQEQEREKNALPNPADIHTLKHVLEYGQECKRLGNEKFKEGLYEEALHIYSQGDDMMKKWKVEKHMKQEQKWLQDYHIACLKNKAQAALRLERWQTALDAADGALGIDAEDHKALFRKSQALKGLGKFKEAEESLQRLEEVAQWNPDRSQILKDCDAERKRVQIASAKHRESTRGMLGRAFEAGVFSGEREEEAARLADSALQAARSEAAKLADDVPIKTEAPRKLERDVQLTVALAGDLMDELTEAYGQRWFQERVQKCARDSGFQKEVFLPRLRGVAFDVQKPILEKWGFEGSVHGVREMTMAIRECARNPSTGRQAMPDWLQQKQDRCLELLYGGREGGMAAIING